MLGEGRRLAAKQGRPRAPESDKSMSAQTQLDPATAVAKLGELSVLFADHDVPCISIYLPVKRGVYSTLLKDLLRSASNQAMAWGMTEEEASHLLEPCSQFAQEHEVLEKGTRGIAIFIARDFFHYVTLDEAVAERVEVRGRFFVRPILHLMPEDARYFVLALSQKHVRLLEGSRTGLRELKVEHIPENLREDFENESFERQTQFHTALPANEPGRSAIYHGGHIQHKERIAHFFHDVDEGIASRLKGQRAPLIVAAVHYLFPIYQEVNTYPHLLNEPVAGNPDNVAADALHEASWKIARKNLDQARDQAVRLYKEQRNTERTSDNIRKIVGNAAGGRIRYLLIPPDAEQWGSFVAPETVHLHKHPEKGDEDLVNLAAILSLRHGVQVFEVPANVLPEGAAAGAVFRY